MAAMHPFLAPWAAAPDRIPYLLDLTLWHRWHAGRGTLPPTYADASLAQIAQTLGAPAWVVERPWRVVHRGVGVTVEQMASRRTIRYETSAGSLSASWQLGPDGDWWQVEYPVKTAEDLPAALAVVAAQEYILAEAPARSAGEEGAACAEPASASITALELPMRPYADLLHTLLGWGEGLLLLKGEGRPLILELLAQLEEKLGRLTEAIADRRGAALLAPDNLDGQYVSPRVFREYMAESYRRAADASHRHGKALVVHAGGPVRRLLPLLAEAGVDVVDGVAPPPQGDATLAEARAAAGPDLVLWGGIPQDYLLPEHAWDAFEAAVTAAARQAQSDGRTILGVADRVPVDADLARLQAIPQLIQAAAPPASPGKRVSVS